MTHALVTSSGPVPVSGDFVGLDGTQYPSIVLFSWPASELAAIGVYPVIEHPTPPGKRIVSASLVFKTSPDRVEREATFEDIPEPPPPSEIHIAWLRAALAEAEKLDQVDAVVASQGPVKQALWDFATSISRTDPDVVAIAAALSIDLGAVFKRADEIRQSRGM